MSVPDPARQHGGVPSLLDLYENSVDEVYRYVRSRCGSTELAEELTSATFVQAALASARDEAPPLNVGWLITVARNKLVDHWRHQAVVERSLRLLDSGAAEAVDPWDTVLDQQRSAQVLHSLPPAYRCALTLRYLDDMGVPECAELLDRSVRAIESLLVRARRAFRQAYDETGGRHND